MKRLRWQIVIVILALVAIGFLLLGHEFSLWQKPEILPGNEPTKEQPISGGVYTEAIIGTPGRLNPMLDWYNNADRDIDHLLYNSLIRFDEHGSPKGDLADSWGISQDGKTYNFLIRQAYWHDGQPVTSGDVVFTANLLRSEALPFPEDFRKFWEQVEVEALDEAVVQFRLPEAHTPFFDYLRFGILPAHIWSDTQPEQFINSKHNLAPIGSGPYRFKRFLTQERQIIGVELEANNNYFLEPPFIEKIVFRYFPDAISALNEYQTNYANNDIPLEEKLAGISRIPTEQILQALKQENLRLYTSIIPKLNLVLFNINESNPSALQDPIVRRALLLGLNRQWILDHIMKGQAVLADGPVFPASWAYFNDLPEVQYDPDKAVNLLKDAGYTFPAEGGDARVKDTNKLEFEMVFSDTGPYPSIARAIQEDWARLGVILNLKPVAPTELVQAYLTPRQFQIALVEFDGMRFPDPDPYPFWHQTQITRGQNYSGWNDRQASEYLEQARVILEPNERARLYQNFQFRFMNELPSLPLFYPTQTFGVDQRIRGVEVGPLFDYPDRFNSIAKWYISGLR